MKDIELRALAVKLGQTLPESFVQGPLLVVGSLRHLLRGVSFEPSGFNKTSFSATAFVLPLFVPTKHLHFTFGNRLRTARGGSRWDVSDEDIDSDLAAEFHSQVEPFLLGIVRPEDFLAFARSFAMWNPHVENAIAFTLARVGRDDEALAAVDHLRDRLDLAVGWQANIAVAAEELKRELLKSGNAARRLLDRWEDETLSNLGLRPPASDSGDH